MAKTTGSILRGAASGLALMLGMAADGGAQTFQPEGSEYAIAGSFPGDQVFPSIDYRSGYGFVVWQDSSVDGKGFGIAARQLGAALSADNANAFRVNTDATGDQEHPKVALLPDGSAFFVWQSGPIGKQVVKGRVLGASGAFTGSDFVVGSGGGESELDPSVAVLKGGNIIVVWSKIGADGDLQGVYGRILSPLGQPVGADFRVNQFTSYNQRNASVAALKDGGFAVVWVSEQQRAVATPLQPFASVDVYSRLFNSDGTAQASEKRVSTEDLICANPEITAAPSGGFVVAWAEKSRVRLRSWDIKVRWYDAGNAAVGAPVVANTLVNGQQTSPSVRVLGDTTLVAWVSNYQDGLKEGVFGQVFRNGSKVGPELKVNSWTGGSQTQPVVATDGSDRFAVVWSSFVGQRSMDIHAQRYSTAAALPEPEQPWVSGLSQSAIQVAWAPVLGFNISKFEWAADGGTPVATTQSLVTHSGLSASSSHSYKVRYVLANGDVSPWSKAGTGSTWGADENFDGLPDDWQASIWGADESQWPAGNVDSDQDGATNAREFQAGTDPRDANSVLKLRVQAGERFTSLFWNTVPGFVYQVQVSRGVPASWESVGGPRLSRDVTDHLSVEHAGKSAVYRVLRLR